MKEQLIIENLREKFPVTKSLIYFDHAAVAPIHLDSVKAVNEYLEDLLQNGDRNYGEWHKRSETIRQGMASFIGAEADEIAFIKNTSQGISLVAGGLEFQPGDNVVIPDIEFPANVYPWMALERKGVKVKFVESVRGEVPFERIAEAIDKNTKVVSVSSIEFSSGYKNDLKAIGQLCQDTSNEYGRKIFFCVDAIQSMGAMELNVREANIDFLSADAHKWFLTPEGAGIFYCRKELLDCLFPATIGWKSVENPLNFSQYNFDLQKTARKFEEGSLNMMGIVAMGASLDLFNRAGIRNIEQKILKLTRQAIDSMLEKGISVVGSLEDRHRSGIVCFKTRGNLEEDHKHFLENRVQLSLRGGQLRISPHFYNNEEEIDRFCSLLS